MEAKIETGAQTTNKKSLESIAYLGCFSPPPRMLAHGKSNSDFLNLKQFFVILVVTGILGTGTPKLEGMKKYEIIHTFNRFW